MALNKFFMLVYCLIYIYAASNKKISLRKFAWQKKKKKQGKFLTPNVRVFMRYVLNMSVSPQLYQLTKC